MISIISFKVTDNAGGTLAAGSMEVDPTAAAHPECEKDIVHSAMSVIERRILISLGIR